MWKNGGAVATQTVVPELRSPAGRVVNRGVVGIDVLEIWLPSLDTFRTFAGQMTL
jgi:hypothetical protein